MYSKNNKGPNNDPWGTLQFMVPASKKTVPNEKKKALFVRCEYNYFIVFSEKPMHLILSNKFYDL